MYVLFTAVRTTCAYGKYLLMTYGRNGIKSETNEYKKLAGEDKVVEAAAAHKGGRDRAKNHGSMRRGWSS